MGKRFLSLKDLHELDRGKGNAAINHHIRQAVMDVIDRPGDKAKRKVNIQLEFTPELDKDTGVLDVVKTMIKVKTTVPIRQTAEYPMLPTPDGRLQFQTDAPFDPRQDSLFEDGRGGSTINTETGEVIVDDDEPTEQI